MVHAPIQLKQVDIDDIFATPANYVGLVGGDDGTAYLVDDQGNKTKFADDKNANVELVGNNAYRFGLKFSQIDSTANGAWTFDGAATFVNKLGVNNTKPTVEPATGARDNDAGYVAGTALTAAIIAGYNNVNNALAGLIASNHCLLYSGADHCSAWGGSLHTIHSGSSYSTIVGGTSNTIEALCQYSGIYNSDSVQLKTSGDINTRGHRSTVLGSSNALVRARNTVLIGCNATNVDGAYNTLISSDSTNVVSGIRNLVVATNTTLGNTTLTSYSLVVGLNHSVNAGRSLVCGEGHTIGNHPASVVTGIRCQTHHAASRVHGHRHRADIPGANQLLEWVASQETTDTASQRLSVSGASTFPRQPPDSVVTGRIHVTGVSDAGTCSAFVIDLVSRRLGTANPTLHHNATTTLFNGLSIVTVPTVNVTTDGIYRVQVVGIAATNIRWTATFYGHMTVFS
jgi:hypothetical protein